MEANETDRINSTRREFLKSVAAATTLAMTSGLDSTARGQTTATSQPAVSAPPWYRRAVRWGQTNITEADAARYDIGWWRQYWKETEIDGVVINAGGIYAYYPSKFPLHYRPPQLGDHDLYGELAKAAREQGLAVVARMDSSRGREDLYRAHPSWFAVDAGGKPFKSGEFYLTCINGPYYREYLPGILTEIIERSHPDGVTDNSWSGPDRNTICHCENCAKQFQDYSGKTLPAERDWHSPAYRAWIDWSYARRLDQWDFNNHITRSAGGPDCLWIGMNGASVLTQSVNFRDMKEICARSEIVMLDNQARTDAGGLQENALDAKLVRGLLGSEKLVPESMAMYQAGVPQFRLSSKPTLEARMWMLSGIAGGVQPWWHHVGAGGEDRRAYQTAGPVFRWHKANQEYLLNRRPLATVAVGWSQRNVDFFGRDEAEAAVAQPWRGFTNALVRARIPFVPLHLDDLNRRANDISVLVLPDVGVITDDQVDAIKKFVQNGGSLIATGRTSLFDQWGDARSDFALADLFGVKGAKEWMPPAATAHTYLRLEPADHPPAATPRHPILAGLEETDILAYGGLLIPLSVAPGAQTLLTFIPPFPTTPPENAWMRQPRTKIPGLVITEAAAGNGRVAFMPADIDRRFALYNLPDHGNLLANTVCWAIRDNLPLEVRGPGLVNCELYEQENRMILHVVNLTSTATWRASVDELTPVGPLHVRIQWKKSGKPRRARTLVTGEEISFNISADGWVETELKPVLDHEVIVLEG